MFIVPVPRRMFLVDEAIHARNVTADVMFSARSVTCSPTYPSVYPSSSARTKASRSSTSDRRQSLHSGWTGIVKKPSFIQSAFCALWAMSLVIAGFEKNDYSYFCALSKVMVHADAEADTIIRSRLRGSIVYGGCRSRA